MARKKVSLQLIGNESSRRVTYKKRRDGLMKKVRELSILCGVEASAVVYGRGEIQPEVWPEEHEEAKNILRKFKSMPQVEQYKRMMNQESFIKQSVSKHQVQLRRLRQENQNLEIPSLMVDELEGKSVYDIGVDKLFALAKFVEEQIDTVKSKIDKMQMQPPVRVQTTRRDEMFFGSNWCSAGMEGLEDIIRPYTNVDSTLAVVDPNLFDSCTNFRPLAVVDPNLFDSCTNVRPLAVVEPNLFDSCTNFRAETPSTTDFSLL